MSPQRRAGTLIHFTRSLFFLAGPCRQLLLTQSEISTYIHFEIRIPSRMLKIFQKLQKGHLFSLYRNAEMFSRVSPRADLFDYAVQRSKPIAQEEQQNGQQCNPLLPPVPTKSNTVAKNIQNNLYPIQSRCFAVATG